jgi:N-glycosylase/DNA lyase
MESLLEAVKEVQQSEVKKLINRRIQEFKELGEDSMDRIFNELCFCITTANCSAERCIEVQEKISDGFLTLSETELALKLRELKYRFPNVRSKFIIEARKNMSQIDEFIKSENSGNSLRDWIVKNIKGIGYKEASHFLRNIGFNDYAIIDFHIVDLLVKYNLIQKPKTLTKYKYLEIEKVLKNIGEMLNLNLAELDLYLWFLETGKILK